MVMWPIPAFARTLRGAARTGADSVAWAETGADSSLFTLAVPTARTR